MVGSLGLSPLEEWAALRLLDLQWVSGALPKAPSALLGYLEGLGLSPSERRRIRVVRLLELFPEGGSEPERRRNPDLEVERERAIERGRSLSLKGKKGAAGQRNKGVVVSAQVSPEKWPEASPEVAPEVVEPEPEPEVKPDLNC